MTTLLNRALIPTMLDQQIDLSTPTIGATIDVDLAKAFSAPAEELEKLTQQLYTTLIDHLVVFLENQDHLRHN